jgi:hypothetical protein
VVYYDEEGNKELINKFEHYVDAEECYQKCMEGDREAQINQSYDIEESFVGVPC